jgi:hypothetical protein
LLTYSTPDYISEYLGYKAPEPARQSSRHDHTATCIRYEKSVECPPNFFHKQAARARLCSTAYSFRTNEESRARWMEGCPMTDANMELTTEDLWARAMGNATAFVLTTFAYLEERGMAVEDYVDFFGRQFAPGWDELRDSFSS